MSFILEFSIEVNAGYYLGAGIGLSRNNMIKVANNYQLENIGDLRNVLSGTYGEFKVYDAKQYAVHEYNHMLGECASKAAGAAMNGVKRFTIAKADDNVSIEIKYYEEVVQ